MTETSPPASSVPEVPSVFIIDNYDSFTFNLVHLVEQLGVFYTLRRNDEFEVGEIGDFSHVLIGPGPGIPAESGKVMQAIAGWSSRKSMFGVCLGMQALLGHFGANMTNMEEVQHGAQSTIDVRPPARLFRGFHQTFKAGRYHSWAFRERDMPEEFNVTGKSADGYVMAAEHRELPLFGVQFHPESIMTEGGLSMMQNWLKG